jgi:hypothetical protein
MSDRNGSKRAVDGGLVLVLCVLGASLSAQSPALLGVGAAQKRWTGAAAGTPVADDRWARARAYLDGRYDATLGLLREAVGGDFERTFWTVNDGPVAARAYRRLGDDARARAIGDRLQAMRVLGHDAYKNLGWIDPFIHAPDRMLVARSVNCYCVDPATGRVAAGPFQCAAGQPQCRDRFSHEEANGGPVASGNHVNLAASVALSRHKAGDGAARDRWIRTVESHWDEQHGGFFGGREREAIRPAYYLAVYLLLGHKTGWRGPFVKGRREQVERMLLSMQNPDGGWPTWYETRNGAVSRTNGHANVETTSLVVYAFHDPAGY